MVTVPTAPPTGQAGLSSIVAVNSKSKWGDPVFLLTAISSFGSMVAAIVDVIPDTGDIHWRSVTPKIIFAVINGVAAFLRTQINTVTR